MRLIHTITACLAVVCAHAAEPTPEQEEFFERQIRPIFAEHCVECHGPEKQEHGLRLDTHEGLIAGGKNGPAIVASNPEASLIYRAIQHVDEPKMPPPGPIADDAVEAIRNWIAMGAPWPKASAPIVEESMDTFIRRAREDHWAFRPVEKPAVPESGAQWSDAPVDRFVHARLESAGLTPSEVADDRTVVRRLYNDLIGLPPEMADVRAFSENDYAQLVEELLASPRYGEKWARHWLDVARYSDTKGYVFQEDRNFAYSHTYRDYVIRAYNEDIPYDRFVKHQLAADLMDLGDDKRPLAAMGYLTLGRRFVGNIHDVTDDRIDVVTRGMLGLTVTCARCHEHKYDPVPTEDYYALYGVFRSSSEPGEPPLIREPDPEDPTYQEFQRILNDRQAAHDNYHNEQHENLLTGARAKLAAYLLASHDTREMTGNEALQTLARDRDLLWQLVQRWRDHMNGMREKPDAVFAPWIAFAALPTESFAEAAKPVIEQIASGTVIEIAVNPAIVQAFKDQSPASMSDVANIYANAVHNAEAQWQSKLAAQAQIAAANGQAVRVPTGLDDANLEALRQVLYADNSPANIKAGEVHGLSGIPVRDQFTRLRNSIENHKSTHPGRPDRAMSLVEGKPFDPYVFKRGKAGARGDDVPRQFLAVLSSDDRQPFQNGSGRLELAEAIANPSNPLTARVYVNRIWMHLMGSPIVGTPSDFGLRSDDPTHPELLDYLAAEFIENGWSTKWLIRTIVNSKTYRQSSFDRPEAREIDPENKLLWRQNRKRLTFEAMRDGQLAVADRLDLTMGGPSVTITNEPFSTRRTVYARIERQNLPGLFRTFDFASPDTHSPARFETTVPQQALFLMNSPFVVEQARALMKIESIAAIEDPSARIEALFAKVYQRKPEPNEIENASNFLDRASAIPPPEPPASAAWQYGYGAVDTEAGTTASFTPYPHFNGKAWQGGDKLPDEKLGWSSVHATGGHPGNGVNLAAIRRWVSPIDGTFNIRNRVAHGRPEGDGVYAYIVHNRHGILWQAHAHNDEQRKEVEDVPMQKGDIVDFIITCGGNTSHDSFEWRPQLIAVDGMAQGGRATWKAQEDFAGPAPPRPEPITPWQQLAQALLLSNEFMFVD